MTQDSKIPKIAGLVLAAGYSSRMGAFKPLLPLVGATAVETVIHAFFAAGIDDVRVVVGYRGDDIAAVALAAGARVVPNPDYDKGMFSSIQAGIAALPDDCSGCLLLPVDVPLVEPETIRLVAETALLGQNEVIHPICKERRGHPPYLARALFAEILASDGEGGLRALLARHADKSLSIPVTDEGILRDMDTPADYQTLQAMAIRRQARRSLHQDRGQPS